MRLGVVGLGLIGGSVALAAKRRLGARVVGVDRPGVLALPRAAEVADERFDVEASAGWQPALREVDVVVLAVPVRGISTLLPRVLECGVTVTDCGSTKRQLAALAQRLSGGERFVPGHPMAGAPEGGLSNARADLFEGRRWLLCPERSEPSRVAAVTALARGVGAIVTELTAVEHDRVVALTSHVPQLVSSVLAVLAERRSALSGAGPAFLAATRRAGGDTAMWGDIYATNHDEVAAALWDVAQELEGLAAALDGDEPDLEPVVRLLERARAGRSQ